MIRRLSELTREPLRNVRGGTGEVSSVDYLRNGEMAGVLNLEGSGTGILNGETFPVEAGDMFLVKAGGSHGLSNGSQEPLTFLRILTRQG